MPRSLPQPPWTTPRRAAACLLLLTALVYAGALGGGYILDDEMIYLDDPSMPRQTIGSAFSGAVPKFLWHPAGYCYYRPATVLLHSWLARGFAGQPFWLHLFSLAAHAGAALAAFLLVARFAEARVAWLAAALFVAHPLHVEAVAWMAGLPEVVAAGLMFVSLYAVVAATPPGGVATHSLAETDGGLKTAATDRGGSAPWLLAVAYLAAAAAMLTKESALALPLMAVVFVGRRAWPFFGLAAGSLLLRRLAVGSAAAPLPGHVGWGAIKTAAAALLHYVWKLVWPWPLALDYNLSFSAASWLVFFLALALLAWLGWRWPQMRRAALLLVLPLLPALAATLVLPSQGKVQDRYAYAAVLGFALLAAHLARHRRLAWFIPALLVAWGFLSIGAIRHWQDPEALWTNTLRVTPNSRNAVLGLGDWYYSTARFEEADRVYQQGLAMLPGDRAILASQAAVRAAMARRKK
jgi:hypothetical protein